MRRVVSPKPQPTSSTRAPGGKDLAPEQFVAVTRQATTQDVSKPTEFLEQHRVPRFDRNRVVDVAHCGEIDVWQGRRLGCSSFNCLLMGAWRGLPGRIARCQHGKPDEWRISRTIDRGCHDRPSAMLDTASGIGEALTERPAEPDVRRRESDECRCAFRCPENGPADRCRRSSTSWPRRRGSPSSRRGR